MTPRITIGRVGVNDDYLELEVTASDGDSQFRTNAIVGYAHIDSIIAALDRFKGQVYGGICDVQFGEFGPEYTRGACQVRLHFHPRGRGRLSITVRAESEWRSFNEREVASQATLYLASEPACLDNFIGELRMLQSGTTDTATLECV
jgi:hypothetical protein